MDKIDHVLIVIGIVIGLGIATLIVVIADLIMEVL